MHPEVKRWVHAFRSITFCVIAVMMGVMIVAVGAMAQPAVYKTESAARISLNFQDISVRTVLQLLAEFSGLNIIASDAVHGNITLHLANIPWDQALEIILQSQGLGQRRVGNVLLIAPIGDITTNEKQSLEAEQEMQDLAPLQAELIQINYGKAADIAMLLKGQETTLLSNRGSVSVDARTNTVWVQDTVQKLVEIRRLVHQLDVPAKQVLIEGRIVNVNCDFEEQLGVKFGITNPDHLSSTLAGASQHLNMDLPAQALSGANPATIGLALAKIGKGTLLDLELSALESEGGGRIISSPRIITADQQAAQIQSGQEIPYQESTASGATSVAFKNAVLSLNVTPQITPDGKVLLTIKVNQDKVAHLVFNGVPAIDTRQIETQVLVNDGETIVLGGIYETDHANRIDRVPFLGSIPIIGSLFRHTAVTNRRQELLIFVTPHIVKPP